MSIMNYLYFLTHSELCLDQKCRQRENMCTNPSIHCFADKCIRSQLPIVLNNTLLRILQKIYTHSYKGFTNYVKHFINENYQMECLVQNCYVCKS